MTMNGELRPTIRLMIPDMPEANEVYAMLQRIDSARHYTNFGPLVREFESRITGVLRGQGLSLNPESLTVTTASSGTVALELAITGLGVGDDAHVMVPALTFPGTATAVVRAGGSVVLVDVHPDTWCLTPEIAHEVLEHTQVDLVIPVAGFGNPVPAGDWDRFVAETGIPVLIDAAASFGSQQTGSMCVTAFSLHATKTLSTGEGGLVASSSREFIERVRQLSNFGFCGSGRVGIAGQNGKLSEYHAAVGLAQLARLDDVYSRRLQVWEHYRHRLSQVGGRVKLQSGDNYVRSVFPVRIPGKNTAERLSVQLGAENVETRRWYCPPLNEQPAFSTARVVGPGGGRELPVTKELSRTLLGLPFHSFLSEFEVARVCSLLSRFVDANQPGLVRDGVA